MKIIQELIKMKSNRITKIIFMKTTRKKSTDLTKEVQNIYSEN